MIGEYFVFDGVDSREFGISAFDGNTFGGMGREYNLVSIPGKSGGLLIDNRRYPNVQHSYSCVIYKNCEENLDRLRNFLLSRSSYKRLEDTIHPEEFYQAYYSEEFISVLSSDRSMCKFKLNFNRKPQRFMRSGENKVTYTSNGKISNPSYFSSRPLIKVYGTGSLGIGQTTINITQNSTYIDIDCDIMEAFTGTASKNNVISFSGNDFPVLHSGENGISLGSGITKVEITPRWFLM